MPGGGVNVPFLAGLKRRVLGVVLRNPGVSERDIVRSHLAPALTPRCAMEVVDMMVSAGQLLVRMGPSEREEQQPPALLLRPEAAAKLAETAAAEPAVRHLFVPCNPKMWAR